MAVSLIRTASGLLLSRSVAKSCGANAKGGGGFQPGNDCASGNGGGRAVRGGDVNPKVLSWAKDRFNDESTARNFVEWFGDSRVVDENGDPKVLYHGTNARFTTFDEAMQGATDDGYLGKGFYFATDEEWARGYGDIVMDVYVSIEKPFNIPWSSDWGHDSVYDVRDSLATLPGMPPDLQTVRDIPEGYVLSERELEDGDWG